MPMNEMRVRFVKKKETNKDDERTKNKARYKQNKQKLQKSNKIKTLP